MKPIYLLLIACFLISCTNSNEQHTEAAIATVDTSATQQTEVSRPNDSIGTARLWVCPATGNSNMLNHTWVTNTANVPGCTPPAHYWYCWGVCHPAPSASEKSKLLKEAPFNLDAAKVIAAVDEPAPSVQSHAGITGHYAYRGVCHQVSNRVLYATAVGVAAPITVRGAKGYKLSRHLYGVYGRGLDDEFTKVVESCGLDPKYINQVRFEEAEDFKSNEKGRYSTPAVLNVYTSIRNDMHRYMDSLEPSVESRRMTVEQYVQAVEKRMTYLYSNRLAPAMGRKAFEDMFASQPGEPLHFLDLGIARMEDEARR